MWQKSKQNLSKWQLCDRNYQLRCLRAMSYPDVTQHDMTCHVKSFSWKWLFFMKKHVFLHDSWEESVKNCHAATMCDVIVSHDMTWIGKTCLKTWFLKKWIKTKKVKEAALKEKRELKRKTKTQSCKPKHGSFLTTQEVPQSARWL